MIWVGVAVAAIVGGLFLAERITRPTGGRNRQRSDGGGDGGIAWFGGDSGSGDCGDGGGGGCD